MTDIFDIVTPNKSDRANIRIFLSEHFFKEEPLNIAAGMPSVRNKDETTFPQEMLAEGLSLMAVTRNNRDIIGVILNKCKLKSNTPAYGDSEIGRFLNQVENNANIWEITGADRAFCINMLAVSETWRGRGIGKALMEHSRKIALSAGYPLLYALCTSFYSARIARNMGMQSVYSLPYSEYKNQQGEPVFIPPLPHTEATIFVQKL